MSATSSVDRNARIAISVTFLITGATLGNLIPRLPDIKADLSLTNSAVGLALLGAAVGSLISMQLVGGIVSRRGTRGLIRAMSLTLGASLLFIPLLAQDVWTLALAAFLFGLLNGGLDIAMNSHAVAVERRAARPIMNSMHALFSLGGVSGAVTGGFASSHELSLYAHFGLFAVATAALSLATAHWLLHKSDEIIEAKHDAQTSFSYREVITKTTIVIGILALFAFIAEGGLNDWVTIYMRDELLTSPFFASAAFAAFQLSMTIVRFLADPVVDRFGPVMVMRVTALIGALGLGIGLSTHSEWGAIIGFAFAGFGVAVAIPLMFSAAGHAPSKDPGRNLSIVTSMGYIGLFLGPPTLGFVADAVSLTATLFIPVGLLVVIAASANTVRGASGKGHGPEAHAAVSLADNV